MKPICNGKKENFSYKTELIFFDGGNGRWKKTQIPQKSSKTFRLEFQSNNFMTMMMFDRIFIELFKFQMP